jgi:hypothetical protein
VICLQQSNCCRHRALSQRSRMRCVSVILAALYETVTAFGGGLPFALDADGCVVDYQPKCAAQDVHPLLVHLPCVHYHSPA